MEVDDVGGDVVEEVAVVGHHHQRLLPPHQVLLQPQHLHMSKVPVSNMWLMNPLYESQIKP